MFIKFGKGKNKDKVISLNGKTIDIIRLPDKDETGITMNYAIVVIHNPADPPPPAGRDEDASDDCYWNKFTVIAECVTHDAGEVRLGEPLRPLLDKISEAIEQGYDLLDLSNEKLYITFEEVQEMSTKAELSKHNSTL